MKGVGPVRRKIIKNKKPGETRNIIEFNNENEYFETFIFFSHYKTENYPPRDNYPLWYCWIGEEVFN